MIDQVEKQVYIDTLESQAAIIQDLKEKLENYQLGMKIRHDKGIEKKQRKNQPKFTMIYQLFGREIDRVLSERALALLTILTHRMDINTNIVVDERNERMSLGNIAEIMEWPKKKTLQVLNELIELGVIHKCKKGIYTYYIMDYKYAVCGNVDAIIKFLQESITNGNG